MAEELVINKTKVRKNTYWKKLQACVDEYKHCLVVGVDFVGSRQMQEVRMAIRGEAVMVLGKNTIMRKLIRDNCKENPKLAALLPFIKGNMGFVFTNADLNKIRKTVAGFKMPAAAKAGVIAPIDVSVPAGPTGLDPGQTSFFQTLNIATKIAKGCIDIVSEVRLCTAGEKVTTSAVALLSKLGIKPFEFGITVSTVYEDGAVYDAAVLDLNADDLVDKFCGAFAMLAAVSFEIGEVNAATVPHSFGRAFMQLASLAIAAEYDFDAMKAVMAALAAGASSGAGGAAGGAAAGGAAAAAAEEDEEEEAAPAMDMFGAGDAAADGDY